MEIKLSKETLKQAFILEDDINNIKIMEDEIHRLSIDESRKMDLISTTSNKDELKKIDNEIKIIHRKITKLRTEIENDESEMDADTYALTLCLISDIRKYFNE